MRRPADQAKLLFLALLRSSAALASSGSSGAAAVSQSATKLSASASAVASGPATNRAGLPFLDGHINLRVARRSDVPMIQRCNLATLPENYSPTFYHNHMRQWPDLSLVAEHIPAGCEDEEDPMIPMMEEEDRYGRGKRVSRTYGARNRDGRPLVVGGDGGGRKIVAYVLGKVEHGMPVPLPRSGRDARGGWQEGPADPRVRFPPSTVLDEDDERGLFEAMSESFRRTKTESLGHVTSLAVLPDYRRRGLAAQLMEQLHFHMRDGHRANAVGLHVRQSNGAAARLYRDGMGYDVHDVIRGYYQDGEDAYFMRKQFLADGAAESAYAAPEKRTGRGSTAAARMRRGLGPFSAFRSSQRQWQMGPDHLRLPRVIRLDDDELMARPEGVSTASTVDEDEEEQIMTGAM